MEFRIPSGSKVMLLTSVRMSRSASVAVTPSVKSWESEMEKPRF